MGRSIHWAPLIEKFRSKLSKWKAKSLSIRGRLTLCKSVLGALATYFFSLYKAPEKVLQELERIRMNFFWGGSMEKRKVAWISWKKILGPKESGGLGIGSLKAQNFALLGKWWWKFLDYKLGLWKDVIKSLHRPNGSLEGTSRINSGCWGAIAQIQSNLSKLSLRFIDLLQTEVNELGVSSLRWELDRAGGYSVSSYSSYVDKHCLPHGDARWVWNPLVPRKINILAWRALCAKLPTKENLKKIGLNVPLCCKICNQETEDEDHMFARCSVTIQVWKEVQKWWYCLGELPSSCAELLNTKLAFVGPSWLADVNEAICLTFVWVIWSFRNKGVFKNEFKSHMELAAEIKILSHLWINARKKKGRNLDWSRWVSDPVSEIQSF